MQTDPGAACLSRGSGRPQDELWSRKLSRHSPVDKAMDYMLRCWELFAGSDRGGARAAAMYTLTGTAKLNNVDPQAWLADVLGRIAEIPQSRLDKLLPWNWGPEPKLDRAA